jgi:hypothetical protein
MARRNVSGVEPASNTSLNGRQTFAPDAAAVAQGGAAASGAFAREKTMLPFAAAFGRLILSFHKFKNTSHPESARANTQARESPESERGSIAMKL